MYIDIIKMVKGEYMKINDVKDTILSLRRRVEKLEDEVQCLKEFNSMKKQIKELGDEMNALKPKAGWFFN